jgi:hypothetical protein
MGVGGGGEVWREEFRTHKRVQVSPTIYVKLPPPSLHISLS